MYHLACRDRGWILLFDPLYGKVAATHHSSFRHRRVSGEAALLCACCDDDVHAGILCVCCFGITTKPLSLSVSGFDGQIE